LATTTAGRIGTTTTLAPILTRVVRAPTWARVRIPSKIRPYSSAFARSMARWSVDQTLVYPSRSAASAAASMPSTDDPAR
jgi:hypothetical protein